MTTTNTQSEKERLEKCLISANERLAKATNEDDLNYEKRLIIHLKSELSRLETTNTQHTPGPDNFELFEREMRGHAKAYVKYWGLPEETKDGYTTEQIYCSGYVIGYDLRKQENSELKSENETLKRLLHEALMVSDGYENSVSKLEAINAELLEALKTVRRHGLIESDGYETVVRQVGEAIAKAEGKEQTKS